MIGTQMLYTGAFMVCGAIPAGMILNSFNFFGGFLIGGISLVIVGIIVAD